MAKSIAREVKKNSEDWAKSSRPVKVERTFPAGRGQPPDQAPNGGYLQRKSDNR
jgi:hypothetical protein